MRICLIHHLETCWSAGMFRLFGLHMSAVGIKYNRLEQFIV